MRFVLLSAVLFCAAGLLASKPPNILFILIDDLGAKDLGCTGSKFYRTPNIDRLARQAMRFTDAYAACQVCSPTRAAIMTGKYPARLHITDWLPGRSDRPDQKLNRPGIRQELPAAEITIAEALKKAGYATGHIGKWHLGGEGSLPTDHGFDVNIGGTQWGYPGKWYPPYKQTRRDGSVNHISGLEDVPEDRYLTDALNDKAISFIEHNHDRPFFLHLSHYTVHIPLEAPKELVAKYPAMVDVQGQQTNAIYAGMIESLDNGIGRIMKKLEELKLADNTVIFFTSDNGGLCTLEGRYTPATYNSPYREGKGFIYEGGIRVPLLVKWPGQTKPGTVCKIPVSSIDFYPTILKVAGLKEPSEHSVDGADLTAVLSGKSGSLDRPLYWHYPHYSNQGGRPAGAIRDGTWKLIQHFENGALELFDVTHGREGRNLIDAEPKVATSLSRKLEAWRRGNGAQMMMPNPDYKPNQQKPDGNIPLLCRHADIHGTMLRYEPMPHKNTLGYWVNESDWASWEFHVSKPGTFDVVVTQGCGKGQGGSDVEFAVGDQTLVMEVKDTGHFQNFIQRNIGRMKLAKGQHVFTVKPLKKAKNAVMDLPRVVLQPVR
ncbi:MAG: sulfatase [Limisphaerales bacterium]